MESSEANEESTRGEPGGEGGGEEEQKEAGGLSHAQKEALELCVQALKHSPDDNHTLAALLVITRVCPAKALDRVTLSRVFSAVGLDLPARLLVTALRDPGVERDQSLAPDQLLSLGASLLAALSLDPALSHKPQLLSTVPVLLQLLSLGPRHRGTSDRGHQGTHQGTQVGESAPKSHNSVSNSSKCEEKLPNVSSDQSPPEDVQSPPEGVCRLDEATAADCYQVLLSVLALPLGPDQLLSRGAVPALCRAVTRRQTLSAEKGIPLLGSLLSGKTKDKAWSKHPRELFQLLSTITDDFCRAPDQHKLDFCDRLILFLPPSDVALEAERLRAVAGQIWTVLRPQLQSRLAPRQTGAALVLGASLLDLCGWGPVGPPRFCCLLVNRACVEVRMGLEEPPERSISDENKNIITGCYRIMEAAMEQACLTPQPPAQRSTTGTSQASAQSSTTGFSQASAQSSTTGTSQASAQSSTTETSQASAQSSTTETSQALAQSSWSGLSLQQSRQVLLVLQEAFSAVIYHLQQLQVEESCLDDPFVFASFRSLCSWLAEETSCLREEVTALLPFLIGYCKGHMGGGGRTGLCDWMERMSVSGERWTGKEPLRFLLPALCHLSAEDRPRKVMLDLEVPLLLVSFLQQTWRGSSQRDPGLETACSVLLNFTVTEPQRVRSDPCFLALETLLAEVLPVVMGKAELLVLAMNLCTLALLMGRHLWENESSSSSSLLSSCLRFLSEALVSSPSSPSPSPLWAPHWDEVEELWGLSLQALSSCVQSRPWSRPQVRETWLGPTLLVLERSGRTQTHVLGVLQGALSSMSLHCPDCRRDICRVQPTT